jgi:hypothetical protein
MTDRDLMQQALDALIRCAADIDAHWECRSIDQIDADGDTPPIITALRERLAHCDRCGKRLGGEGDIHTCSPDPIEDAQSALIAEMAAQPEQQELVGREAYMAIREARENASEDAYFAARPEHDKDLNRLMFRSGFYRGYPTTPPAAPVQPEQQPVNQERESLRAAQGEAVMPLIGPLLDAWESCSETMRGEQPEVDKYLRKINRAMEDATSPAAQRTWVGLTDEEEDAAFERSMEVRPKGASNKETRRLYARAIESKLKERNHG